MYISGLPYSFRNARLLHRAIVWAGGAENKLHKWFSENYNVDVHAWEINKKYCVVNNTYEKQSTVIYRDDDSSFEIELEPNEIRWYSI